MNKNPTLIQQGSRANPRSLTPNPQSLIPLWQNWLEQARSVYQEKLWNGNYYRLDSGSGSDVVMTDQLCGQFYARLLGLPDIVPIDCAESALASIYESCFVNFNQWIQNQRDDRPLPPPTPSPHRCRQRCAPRRFSCQPKGHASSGSLDRHKLWAGCLYGADGNAEGSL